jgi:hypothetical protein
LAAKIDYLVDILVRIADKDLGLSLHLTLNSNSRCTGMSTLERVALGGWPSLTRTSTPEGAPSKLRLGGGFCWCPHIQRKEDSSLFPLPRGPLRLNFDHPNLTIRIVAKAAPRHTDNKRAEPSAFLGREENSLRWLWVRWLCSDPSTARDGSRGSLACSALDDSKFRVWVPAARTLAGRLNFYCARAGSWGWDRGGNSLRSRGFCKGLGVPFGFAQGRLSTAVVLRVREAQPPFRMTDLDDRFGIETLLQVDGFRVCGSSR